MPLASPSPEVVADWVERYQGGESAVSIAQGSGFVWATVCNWLERSGVQRRPGSRYERAIVCKDCGSESIHHHGRCKPCVVIYARKNNLRRRYGITSEQYDRLLAEQQGCCAVCHREPEDRRFCVDHDHACCPGERTCGVCLRGLLCSRCNLALGLLGEHLIDQAQAYLRQHRSHA